MKPPKVTPKSKGKTKGKGKGKTKGKTINKIKPLTTLPTLSVKPWYGKPVQELYSKHSGIFRKCLNPIMNSFNQSYWNSLYFQLYKAKSKTQSVLNSLEFNWDDDGTIPKHSHFSYIPQNIQTQIDEECKHTLRFSFSLMDRKFSFMICTTERPVENGLSDELYNRIHKMITWLIFLNPMIQPTCSKEVFLYFYDISAKKRIEDNAILDIKHINTAFTTGCQETTSIYVFRREESEKVFLHETCHNLGIDFLQCSTEDVEKLDKQLRSQFMLNDFDIRWNESYCELWARVFHTMMFVLYEPKQTNTNRFRKTVRNNGIQKKEKQKTAKDSTKVFYEKWRMYFYYEQLFSLIQCTKLLKHYHLSFEDLGKMAFREKYKENTQGFSYYVLTSILIFHLSDFMDYCTEYTLQTTGTDKSISVQKTDKSIIAYGHMWDPAKWNEKSQYYDIMKKIKSFMETNSSITSDFKETLRMSVLASG